MKVIFKKGSINVIHGGKIAFLFLFYTHGPDLCQLLFFFLFMSCLQIFDIKLSFFLLLFPFRLFSFFLLKNFMLRGITFKRLFIIGHVSFIFSVSTWVHTSFCPHTFTTFKCVLTSSFKKFIHIFLFILCRQGILCFLSNLS
jgi:hypothetical protein